MSFLGSLVSGVFGLGGQAIQNKNEEKRAQQEYERQKEFAQNSIQWKVKDAENAGLHRLAGIGTNATQYIPTSGGSDNTSQAMAEIGQGLGDAIGNSKQRRMMIEGTQLDLESKRLENENKRLQNMQIMQTMGQNTLSNLSNTSPIGLTGDLSGQGTTAGAMAGKIPTQGVYGVDRKPANETRFVKSPEGYWHITPSEEMQDYYSESMLANIFQGMRNAFNPTIGSQLQKQIADFLTEKGELNPKTQKVKKWFSPVVGWQFRVENK